MAKRTTAFSVKVIEALLTLSPVKDGKEAEKLGQFETHPINGENYGRKPEDHLVYGIRRLGSEYELYVRTNHSVTPSTIIALDQLGELRDRSAQTVALASTVMRALGSGKCASDINQLKFPPRLAHAA